ncbi:hypothetical protein K523DRAFT_366119, partial [Schizophyllum commune Tattone D]
MTENRLEKLISETDDLAKGSAFSSGYPSLRDAQIIHAQTARLDEEIERTEARLAEARRVRDFSKALVAPIRRLLPELLSEFFLLATPATWYDECSGNRMQDIRYAEVCHSWRAITLVNVWIARSGGALLTVTFLNTLGDDGFDLGVSAWKRLIGECHRWRAVTVHAPYEFYEGLEDLHFPALVHIHLSAGGWEQEALDYPHPVPAFTNAPNVRQLTCENVRVQYWLPSIAVGARVLETVDRACVLHRTNARHAVGRVSYHALRRVCGDMPHLETLGTANRGCELLYYIDAPALTTLHMTTRGSTMREGVHADQMACLKAMLLRDSSMRLESLLLTDISASCGDIIECLELLPSLGQFSLERIRLGRNGPSDVLPLLRKLTRDNSRPDSLTFLPHLGNLTLSWRSAYGRQERERCMPILTDMLVSRLEDIDAEECYEGLYDFETNLDPDLTLDEIVDIAWERKKTSRKVLMT